MARRSTVSLRWPIARAVREWLACSDLTASMMGPPEFSNPVPAWKQYLEHDLPYFFDGSRPHIGRSFIIEHAGEAIGHVSCSRMDEKPAFAELDI